LIERSVLVELKAQVLKKNNQLTRRTLTAKPSRTVQPRGILLLGVPGTRKSIFARALGIETRWPSPDA